MLFWCWCLNGQKWQQRHNRSSLKKEKLDKKKKSYFKREGEESIEELKGLHYVPFDFNSSSTSIQKEVYFIKEVTSYKIISLPQL